MARQSLSDRLLRLNKGCCPVHGTFMGQVDTPTIDSKGREYAMVACPRKDCSITAKAFGYGGPCKLGPEWIHLLDDAGWQVQKG